MAWKVALPKIFIVAVLGVVALTTSSLAGWLVPVSQERIITRGIDDYQYHRPLFGNVRSGQDLTVEHEINGIGAIIVNLRRAQPVVPLIVTITDPETAQQLDRLTVPPTGIHDDSFAIVRTHRPILAAEHPVIRVTFTAPEATAQNPLGIRFHPDDPYPASQRLENDRPAPGDLALLLRERVSLGQYVYTTITQNTAFLKILGVVCMAVAVALLSLRIGWSNAPARTRQRIEISILLLVALVGFGLRLYWLPNFHGVSGGDPYNYLVITQQLANLDNPFAVSKRLPGFPLLLLPAYLTPLDDINWMRLLSISGASTSIFLAALLARRLRLSWSVQLLTAVLLTMHKDFFWTSFRPEPYTLYGTLLLLALILLFNLKQTRNKVLLGITLGYSAMTRQEGFILAALIGLFTIIFWRQLFHFPAVTRFNFLPHRTEWRGVARAFVVTYLPALLLVLPFFVHSAVTYGNPLYTEYFQGDRLQIVNSFPAFVDNLGSTWGVLGSMWRPQWDQLYRLPLTTTAFLSSLSCGLIWWFIVYTGFYRRSTTLRTVATLLWLLLLCATIWLVSSNSGAFYNVIMISSAALLLLSPIPLLVTTTWRGIIVITIALSQILIALWFHPFAKHYQQAYPLLTLALAVTLSPVIGRYFKTLTDTISSQLMLAASRVAILTALLLVPLFLSQRLNTFIDKYNHRVALDHVVYQAVQVAQTLPGPHGSDQPYIPVHLYFSGNIHYFLGDEPHTPAQALAWITEHGIKTLIDTNNNQAFKNAPADWQLVKSFKAEGRDERIFESRVYRIP